MTTKTKVGLFLMTGLVLAFAALYSLPMQQAAACGKSCHGGGGGGSDDCCGGSLVNVEDNNVGSNIANVKTGDILSDNYIKALNNNKIGNVKDVNVLSKNYLKDVNVLSKNKFLNNILSGNSIPVSDILSCEGTGGFCHGNAVYSNDVLSEDRGNNIPVVTGNTLNLFKLLGLDK
jgi:hypothetical protein